MNWLYIGYIFPQVVGLLIFILLIYDIYPRRDKLMVRMFIYGLAVSVFWIGSYILQLTLYSPTLILFFDRIKFLGIATLPIFWFFFALLYSGNEKYVNKRNFVLLMVPIVINLSILYTNSLHHLFYTGTKIVWIGPIKTIFSPGYIFFWMHSLYSYTLLLISLTLLLKKALELKDIYLKQSLILMIGVFAPLLINLVYIMGLSPLPEAYDITPITFSISGLAFWYAIFKLQLLDIFPIARDEVFEGISDAIFVLDKEDRIIDYNQNAEKLIEDGFISYDRSKIVGKRGKEVFSNRSDLIKKYQNIENGKGEIELADGKEKRYYDVRISFVRGDREEVVGKIIILRDITKRKEAEERAEFLHSLLRHDLGNKLQVTMGFLELMRDSDLSEEDREFLEDSLKGIEEGIELIENVRTLNKIKSEEDKKITDVELKKVIEESIERHDDLRKDQGFEINNKIIDEVKVQGGPVLKELFANLIENSLKHSRGGKIEVSMRKKDNTVAVIVEDNGDGIPDETKDKITKKGFQGEESSGSGLGMHLVKRIAEIYDGEFEVLDSRLGGAKFEIELNRWDS